MGLSLPGLSDPARAQTDRVNGAGLVERVAGTMKTAIDKQRLQLMESGYVIVRNLIQADELLQLRASVDRMAERGPVSCLESRFVMTDWVDRSTSDAVEFWFQEHTLGFSRQLMDVSAVAPLGMFVLCASGTGWHRDIHPIDMAPLDGLQEDLRLNGPPYLQWNVPLYDDNFLHFIPGSHLRRNNAEERKIERRMGVVSLPGAVTVELKAGDSIVYLNNCLHSSKPNGETKRRTLITGYEAFRNKGFTHYYADAMGVGCIDKLSPHGAARCKEFAKLHAQRDDEIVAAYNAIIKKDRESFVHTFEALHPSVHARMTSLIVLSKIAYTIRKYKDSDSDDWQNTNAVKELGSRFTVHELNQLWDRFGTLDKELKADTEQYESLFQNPAMMYHFYEMPANFEVEDFIKSWDNQRGSP